jgi:hypothetical protein|tara:strand:+ start:4486 stop:4761 length:276 start_codon:yes stop_codon:yes gene_type:complete
MGKLKSLAYDIEAVMRDMSSEGIDEINTEIDDRKETLRSSITEAVEKLGEAYSLNIDDLNQILYPCTDTIKGLSIEEKINYYVDDHFNTYY